MKKSRAYVLLAALVVFICICTASLTEGRLPLKREALTLQNDNLRAMRIELTAEEIAQYADECNLPVGEYLCTLMAAENWTADVQTAQSLTHKQAVALRNRLVRHYPEEFYKMSSLYAGLVADMQCFPIPVSKGNEQMWVEYCDSWGLERTYGGERRHEGTDIMAQNNTPGIYPVLSATAGTVTNIGWLELGGWRIGITSENGIYYYYAHLRQDRPYADGLEEGDVVQAGDVIGYMGRTGYSAEENTNNIDVYHLHLGMQLIFDESQREGTIEIWIDVYPLTRFLARHASQVVRNDETKEWSRRYQIRDMEIP